MNELKERRLPTFGTVTERKDRLRKHFGQEEEQKVDVKPTVTNMQQTGNKKSSCLDEIERLK
jgi:hypothetical protein